MTWEQKLEACQALGDTSLRMRKPSDWYVSGCGYEKKVGSVLESGCVINAATPEIAVNQHWYWLTNLKSDEYIVIDAYRNSRRAVRWNGFMWKEVSE